MEAALVLALVFLLRPLETRVEEFMDRFFYRERYLFRLKFFEFNRAVLGILELPVLLQRTVDFVSQALDVDKVGGPDSGPGGEGVTGCWARREIGKALSFRKKAL